MNILIKKTKKKKDKNSRKFYSIRLKMDLKIRHVECNNFSLIKYVG